MSQCVAACCNVCVVCYSVLQCIAVCCSVLQCVVEFCSVLQRVAACCSEQGLRLNATFHSCAGPLHCNTLQHTTSHCNTLHHTATNCNTLQHIATHCNTPHHTGGPTSGVGKSRIQAQVLFTDTNYFVVVCRVGNKIENVRKRGCQIACRHRD